MEIPDTYGIESPDTYRVRLGCWEKYCSISGSCQSMVYRSL